MHPGGSYRFELPSASVSSRFSSFAQPVHHHLLRCRFSGRRLAVLSLDLFNVRHSTRASAPTCRPAVPQRPQGGGPSQALLASDEPLQKTRGFLAHCCSSVPLTVTHGSPRLAPGAAAVLSLRTRESVLRQERCVADLHYFMGAERRARLRNVSAIGASPPSTLSQSLEGSSLHCDSPAAMRPLLCVDHCIDAHASSSTWEELDQRLAMPSRSQRLREFPSASLGVDTASERVASTDEHLDCAGSSYCSAASSLFRQQQTLFDLRRRLAYLLATDCTGARNSDKHVVPLRAIFRRAAFALSLTQSTLEVCTWNAGVAEASRNMKGTSSIAAQNGVRYQFMRPGGVGEPQSSFLLRHLQSDGRGDLPHVYRCLAQPIELTPAEAYALVRWCADQLCTCAKAVAAAAERRNSPEPQSNASDCDPAAVSAVGCGNPVDRGVPVKGVSPAKVMNSGHQRPEYRGTEKGTPCEGPVTHEMSDSTLLRFSTSATRPPSTLWMAGHLSRDHISRATNGRHNTWPSPFDVLESERGEEVVSSATALMGLLSTFGRMAAELVLPMADGFSGLSHEEILSQVHSPTLSKLCDSGESCEAGSVISGGEEFLGRIVGSVVLGVCGALCAVRDSGYLCTYKKKFAEENNGDAAPSRRGVHGAPATACGETQGQGQGQLRRLRGRLSFSPAVFQFVLCCERESWSRALQLTERMSEWNGALDALLGVLPLANGASSTSSHLSTFFASPPPPPGTESGQTTSPFGVTSPTSVAHLRGLNKKTCVMLLYILAQHGRLAEVLGLCEAVLGLDVFRLLHDRSTLDKKTSGLDTLIVLITHLAVANTDPSAVAALVQQVIHSRPVNTKSSAHGDANFAATREDCDSKAPLCTAALDRMRCVEYVVRAGLTPQRVLSVTEYAMLLHRLLGDQIRDDAMRHEPAATTLHSATSSSSPGWWLSPSRVWRSSAGLEHQVRAALCLMGFHVNVRHEQTDMLSLEDLYVVLTITRQLARQRDIDLRQLRRRQVESVGVVDDDDDDSRSMYQRKWWEELGVVAGSTKQKQLNSPSSPHKLLPHSPPHPLTVTGSSAEMCAASDCCSDSESLAPCHVARHGGEELLLHLLPARRLVGSPVGVDHIQQLCATCHAALQLFSPVYIESRFVAQKPATPPRLIPGVGAVDRGTRLSTAASSAVLLFLVSHETLSLLRAVRYTRNISVFWSSALSALAAQQLSGQSFVSSAFGLVQGNSGFSERTLLFSPTTRISESCPQQEGADDLREEVAYALARQAEAAVGFSIVATRRFVAPLIALAPYLSAYTVSDLVQRPFRRAFTWQQCLALLPYTPLGSRSQIWLIRRLAQDSKGRRYVFPRAIAVAGPLSSEQAPRTFLTLSALSTTALETAERLIAVEAAQRRHWGHQRTSERADPDATQDAARTVPLRRFFSPPSGSESPGSVSTDATTRADAALLALLLEVNWQRALQAFEKAPSRVQVGGGSHVVRLLVASDAWRNLCDAQQRRLVRLAIQSSEHSLGGVSSLLEEMLKTTLDHGLWHSGLYFHRSVAVEQPELVQQCPRAQRYAAQLCHGLLRRTSMTKTVAQMTKASRSSQWAEAAACFLRYATQQRDNTLVANNLPIPVHPSSDETRGAAPEDAAVLSAQPGSAACSQAAPPLTARTTDVPPTTSEELESLASLIDAEESSSLQHHTSEYSASSSSLSPLFNLLHISSSSSALIPPELAHVAQTVRYAMLHTPSLWMRALRWLPQTALPLPFDHERAWRVLCADNREKLRALLPAAVQVRVSADEGGISARVSATTEAAFSLVEAARCAHRPQHANEAGKEQQAAVANALRVLHRAGAWEQATLLYDKAVESNCMPYASSSKVLETAQRGGAPWQVTLAYFFRISQRQRPDVNATAVALQACVEGGQWEVAFRVLCQSVLTQATPVPRLVMLAVNTALRCGVWSRALAAAHQYRRTHNPQLAHTVLLTYVRTQRWDDATEYFYDCTRRGLRPLDASLELAIIASEAASTEYRKTALMVGAIASALEDLYRVSGAVLEHIIFVQRQARRGALYWQSVPSSSCRIQGWALDQAADMDHRTDFLFPH